jgi:hypothetical protein
MGAAMIFESVNGFIGACLVFALVFYLLWRDFGPKPPKQFK